MGDTFAVEKGDKRVSEVSTGETCVRDSGYSKLAVFEHDVAQQCAFPET